MFKRRKRHLHFHCVCVLIAVFLLTGCQKTQTVSELPKETVQPTPTPSATPTAQPQPSQEYMQKSELLEKFVGNSACMFINLDESTSDENRGESKGQVRFMIPDIRAIYAESMPVSSNVEDFLAQIESVDFSTLPTFEIIIDAELTQVNGETKLADWDAVCREAIAAQFDLLGKQIAEEIGEISIPPVNKLPTGGVESYLDIVKES